MKIVSYNIKHDTREILGYRKRIKDIVSFLNRENADVIGLQEVTKTSKKIIEKYMPNYNVLGDSRHSGIINNEYNSVLINKKYVIKSYKTYSLSDKINKLGYKFKKDNYPRICVVVHISNQKNKYIIINTHIDNSDYHNKGRMLKILRDIIKMEKQEDEYIILTGDFNMTLDNDYLNNFSKNYLDPFVLFNETTFSKRKMKQIDHIFIDKRLKCDNALIIKNNYSDHYAISCYIK